MWRYNDKTTRSFYTCWRKAIRRLYNIPYRTHNILVHHIINSYPIDVVLEKRCIKYIWNLINSGCKLHADIVFLSMDNMYSTIGENMQYFMYKYKFSTNDWYRPLSFLNNKIDTYVNSTVNFDIVCTATAIKESCQARDMGDTQFFNRQELTIMINTLCKQ